VSDLLRTHIATLRRRARGAELARGLGRLIAVLVAGLACWLAVDYWFVTTVLGIGGWDIVARLAMTGGVLWLAGREAWRGVIAEWRRQRSDDELAMRLEHAHPDLGGRLISTIQLQRSLASGGAQAVGSPALVEALAEETQAHAASLDPRLAWHLQPARSALLLGGALLLAAILFVAWRSDIAAAFARRLAFLSAHYPTATRIVGVSVPALVGRGDPVVIEVEVDPASQVPEFATAVVRGADGRSSTLRLERSEAAGRAVFRGAIAQAIEDLQIRPVAGDHRWEREETMQVVQRPSVSALDLRLVHPAYLHLPDGTSTVGDLQVPAGTRIEVAASFSRAVAQAELVSTGGNGEGVRSALVLAADGRSGRGSFEAVGDGTWSIVLTAADGLGTVDPPRWTVVATPDRAPSIVVTFPPRDKDASRFARWPLRYTARDDHAIAGLRLRWLVIPAGVDPAAVTSEPASLEVPLAASGAAVQGEVPFDLAPLALEAGSRVVWWLEARDARTPEPGVGSSLRGTFTILDPRELRERMAREKSDLLNTLKTIRDRQNDAKAGVEGIRKSIDGK
jgi:hypothetical protein